MIYRRLRRSREHANNILLRREKGEDGFEYIYNRDQQPYVVRFVMVAPVKGRPLREWHKPRIDYPVARLYSDGVKRMIPWTPETLRKCLRRMLQAWMLKQGGVWEIQIEESRKGGSDNGNGSERVRREA